MGVHSTFFGPIKYAILPQHLRKDEVLGGTGLVEAGTYLAILGGTILAGVLADPARKSPRRRRSASPSLGFLTGPAGTSRPAGGRAASARLAHRARVDRAGQRDDAHPAPVPRDLLDQLLLDDRRGADHHLPAAGEECARRRRAGGEPVHRHLLDRDRDRLGADQPPAEKRGVGPLRAGSVLAMGAVRAVALFRRADLGQARRRADHARQFHLSPDAPA